VRGLLGACSGLSASSLRHWLKAVARQGQETVRVGRSDGQEEVITRLQDYQEEAVAQRMRKGLIQGRAIYLDDYVNAVFRHEPLARTKHGTRYGVCQAFRRHMAQDVDTGHAVTCPLRPADVTPLAVVQDHQWGTGSGLPRLATGTGHRRPLVERQSRHQLGFEDRTEVADLGQGHQDHPQGLGQRE